MINGKKILAIIPARGGSKGLPRKNIKLLIDKPLIAWTIEEAKKSTYIDRCIVSTDDEEISLIAKKYGGDVPFLRPKNLAADNTNIMDVIFYLIKKIPGYDYILLLQPTSPLRVVEDIDGCIKYAFSQKAYSCVSVSVTENSPYWMYTISNNRMYPLLELSSKQRYQRQNLPNVYCLNGAIYLAEKKWLMHNESFVTDQTVPYVMSEKRSYDIDTEIDFKIIQDIISEDEKGALR